MSDKTLESLERGFESVSWGLEKLLEDVVNKIPAGSVNESDMIILVDGISKATFQIKLSWARFSKKRDGS